MRHTGRKTKKKSDHNVYWSQIQNIEQEGMVKAEALWIGENKVRSWQYKCKADWRKQVEMLGKCNEKKIVELEWI